MAFWRKAIASLGLIGLLATNSLARGDEAKGETAAQVAQVIVDDGLEQGLEPKGPKKQDKDSAWKILKTRISADISELYRLPDGFSLGLDGVLKGYGFSWRMGGDLYYDDFKVNDYFESIDDIVEDYREEIEISGTKFGDFLDKYDSEKEMINDAFEDSFDHLKQELENIYRDRLSDDALVDFLINLFKALGDDNNGLSDLPSIIEGIADESGLKMTGDEKQKTEDALEDFFESMDRTFQGTESDDVIKELIEQGPLDALKIGGKTLRELIDMGEGFAGLLDIEELDDGFRAYKLLSASGTAHGELSFGYKLKLGDDVGFFNHTRSFDVSSYGKAFVDISFRHSDGKSFADFLEENNVDPLIVLIYSASGEDLYLPDLFFDAELGYRYGYTTRVGDMFESSLLTRHGKQGRGMIYSKTHEIYERAKVDLSAVLDTEAKELSWNFRDYWRKHKEVTESNLFYLFDQQARDRFWHYAMLGIELQSRTVKDWLRDYRVKGILDVDLDLEQDINSRYHNTEKKRTLILPRANLAVGFAGDFVNPFIVLSSYPDPFARAGMIVEIPNFALKLSATHVFDPMMFAPFKQDTYMTLETALVFLDGRGSRKAAAYMAEKEKLSASPKIGKSNDLNHLTSKFYSGLDGLLISAKLQNSDMNLNLVWCSGSSFFAGAGYTANFKAMTHGANLVFGSRDFLLKGSYARSLDDAAASYSQGFSISGSANISENIVIYLDIRTDDLFHLSGRFYDLYYNDRHVTGSLNIAGMFDENKIVEFFSKLGE